ncbi:MAG TPA: hypothetical protein VFD04_06350 [Actinomycetes bacterium]|jgi:hypothetical protein|nr:hypothetical protein [Actinomycetes bacterium]
MAHARISAGSGRAPLPERPAPGRLRGIRWRGRGHAASEGLAPGERQALEQLGAADGYVTRWLVGRAVTRSLARRRLVMVASDYVLLTEAGRRALAGDDQRRGWTAAPVASPGDRGSPALQRGLAWGEAT